MFASIKGIAQHLCNLLTTEGPVMLDTSKQIVKEICAISSHNSGEILSAFLAAKDDVSEVVAAIKKEFQID